MTIRSPARRRPVCLFTFTYFNSFHIEAICLRLNESVGIGGECETAYWGSKQTNSVAAVCHCQLLVQPPSQQHAAGGAVSHRLQPARATSRWCCCRQWEHALVNIKDPLVTNGRCRRTKKPKQEEDEWSFFFFVYVMTTLVSRKGEEGIQRLGWFRKKKEKKENNIQKKLQFSCSVCVRRLPLE